MYIPLTPLDGRYSKKVSVLTPYLSEFGFFKYRLLVEAQWLVFLCSILGKELDGKTTKLLADWAQNFSADDYQQIKSIEDQTNHDVKAIEIWLGQKLTSAGNSELVSLVHFGRTSEDINSLAYSLMLRDCRQEVLLPMLNNLLASLKTHANAAKSMPMLARTHGQPASPSTLGKEFKVFELRLQTQIKHLLDVKLYAKFSGATGTYAADALAYPNIDWPKQMQSFVSTFNVEFNPVTTQIEPHDYIARLCNETQLLGTILTDLSRDIWQYISFGYLSQKVVANEVGSSTMPHKVNPINFENAEANFGIAGALLRHLAEKLPISRLQRDLSDSSALRNVSEAFGHFVVALDSLQTGLAKISPNQTTMLADLDQHWPVLTEAIQTILRKNGHIDAYEQIKKLSRGASLDHAAISDIISKLDIPEADKKLLQNLAPAKYIGLADKL